MSMYTCFACDAHRDNDYDPCNLVTDVNELLCGDCMTDYLCALEERDGPADNLHASEVPTFDRDLFDAFRERQRREDWDRHVAWMERQAPGLYHTAVPGGGFGTVYAASPLEAAREAVEHSGGGFDVASVHVEKVDKDDSDEEPRGIE